MFFFLLLVGKVLPSHWQGLPPRYKLCHRHGKAEMGKASGWQNFLLTDSELCGWQQSCHLRLNTPPSQKLFKKGREDDCSSSSDSMVKSYAVFSYGSNGSISSKMRYSSSFVSARMAIRVSRKLGIPLKSGLAARWRRTCSMPRRSSSRLTLSSTSWRSTFSRHSELSGGSSSPVSNNASLP